VWTWILAAFAVQAPELLTDRDLAAFESPAPDFKIPYGTDALQFGELRLPEGDGPHPVVVLIHGGCWLSRYDVSHIRKLAAALTREGVATWTLEYRRVGNPGGGWPGTFEDVAKGADHLRAVAKEHRLDLDRVLAMGHSAGAQLALWLGARRRFSDRGPFAAAEPVIPRAVLGLAPAADLAYLYQAGACDNAVGKLVGGSPASEPERYRMTSPSDLVPLGLPQILVIGSHDRNWAPVGRRYYEAARAAGDDVRMVEAADSGHFEMIDPDSSTWPLVRDSVFQLLGLRSP
jgi:acetyl esterase/lipase